MNISTTQGQILKTLLKNNKLKLLVGISAMGLLACFSSEALAALDLDKAQKAVTSPLLEFIHNYWGKFVLATGVIILIVADDEHIAKLNPFKRKTIKKNQEEGTE